MISTHIAAAGVALFFVAPVGWMAFDRDPCSVVTAEAATSSVAIGDSLHALFHIDRKQAGCRVVVKQRIFFGTGETVGELAFGDLDIPSPGGVGPDVWPVVLPIASGVPGPARYRAVVLYYKNPLQEWLDWPVPVNPPDVIFTIKAKEPDDGDQG